MQPEMQPAVGCSCNTVALELATKFARPRPLLPYSMCTWPCSIVHVQAELQNVNLFMLLSKVSPP